VAFYATGGDYRAGCSDYLCDVILLFSAKRLVFDGRCDFPRGVTWDCTCLYALYPARNCAFFSGVFCTIAVGYLKTNSRIKEDTVMGIVFSGMFAIGLVMFTKVESNQHLMHILFGDLLGITAHEFYQSLIISAFVFFVIVLKRRDFLLYCFDTMHARTVGLNNTLLHYSLLVLLALVIISAMQVVGVILVVAMLITPGITGYILTKRFERMMLIAILTSVNSVFWGIFLSFHFDAATGPFIVLIQAVVFLTALAVVQLKLRK